MGEAPESDMRNQVALSEDHRHAIMTALSIASKGAIPEDAEAFASAFEAVRLSADLENRSQ